MIIRSVRDESGHAARRMREFCAISPALRSNVSEVPSLCAWRSGARGAQPSRSSRFKILPVGPLGSSAMISTTRGYLYAASLDFVKAMISSGVTS